MAIAVLKVLGMDCAEEVATLRDALTPIPGVSELAFDVLNGKMTVEYVEQRATINVGVERQ
jgi:copper chaperone CopZ